MTEDTEALVSSTARSCRGLETQVATHEYTKLTLTGSGVKMKNRTISAVQELDNQVGQQRKAFFDF